MLRLVICATSTFTLFRSGCLLFSVTVTLNVWCVEREKAPVSVSLCLHEVGEVSLESVRNTPKKKKKRSNTATCWLHERDATLDAPRAVSLWCRFTINHRICCFLFRPVNLIRFYAPLILPEMHNFVWKPRSCMDPKSIFMTLYSLVF